MNQSPPPLEATTHERILPNGYIVQLLLYPVESVWYSGWIRTYRVLEDGTSRETSLFKTGEYSTPDLVITAYQNKCLVLSQL